MISLLAGCGPRPGQAPLFVLAASSLQEAMAAAADAWAAQGHDRPVVAFAASSALARQIENGAAADLFVAADQEWMDVVERGGLLRPGTRRGLVGNNLVLIAPASPAGSPVALEAPALSAALGDGRLAMADPDSVPAGRYGKAAMTRLGLWDAVGDRIARAENVRAALALVERGQAPLGIVYATDARAARRVRVVAEFPDASHPPIRYPAAILAASSHPEAEAFRRFLLSPQGQAIFARYGFRSAAR
ncbi:MAG: molybdate ABC transporter substrate-binding protein [Allosphingosinicella sp.]